MTKTAVNGIEMNVIRLAGPADQHLPTVVFLHGLIMDNLSSYYFTIAPGVAEVTDVLVYDLRGHGMSDRPPTGYTLDDATADLAAVLASQGITEPVVLVGNSFGGTIALHTAITRPDLVAGLGLVEAHPVVPNWGNEIMEDIEEMVAGFDEPGVREFITGDGGRKLKKMAATCETLVNQTSLSADLRAEPPMTAARLATISCPTLCLYGDSSDILDRANMLVDTIPKASLVILGGCTHSVLMEAPDEIESELRRWLGTLSAARRAPITS